MIRTDLATEAEAFCRTHADACAALEGVTSETIQDGTVSITKIRIINALGERAIGKPRGDYITIEAPDLKFDTTAAEIVCRHTAAAIRALCPTASSSKILVVGLGNRDITPDALGPSTIEHLLVTAHLTSETELFGNVCALIPGVLGTTGIESAEIIRGVCREIHPKAVLAIDALAARSPKRLCNTVQIASTGISPGAGIGNRRNGLNEENLGIPVVALGIPTVIDISTIVQDAFSDCHEQLQTLSVPPALKKTMTSITASYESERLIVTPKDIDLIIRRSAEIAARSLNLALHPNLSREEIDILID